MATLYKNRKRYYVQFYDANQKPPRKRFSLKTTDRRSARALVRRLEHDHYTGAFDPWSDDPFAYGTSDQARGESPSPRPKACTFDEALRTFLDEKRQAGRATGTLRTYRHILGPLGRGLPTGRPLASIERAELIAFVRDAKVAPSTRHTRYRHVRSFMRWCVRAGLISRCPLDEVEPPKNTHRLPKTMSEDDLEAVCRVLKADYAEKLERGHCRQGELVWQAALFRFAFYTGLRASELGRLKWKHIDVPKGLIYVMKQKNKLSLIHI